MKLPLTFVVTRALDVAAGGRYPPADDGYCRDVEETDRGAQVTGTTENLATTSVGGRAGLLLPAPQSG